MPDFQLLQPYGFCLKRLRWLHRDQSEDFHRVVLQYVAERSGLFIKWSPRLDTHRFRNGNLYPLYVVPIPNRLEDSIAETKEQNVLHRFFAEIVIDPKYLILGKDGIHIVIELLCRCEIRSEWLLDDDPDPVVRLFSRLRHAMRTKSGDDVGKILGCHRQVEQPVAARAELFIQFLKVVLEPFETVIVVKIRLKVLHAIKKGIKPRIDFRDAPSLEDSVLHFGNERLGEIAARYSHDCEFFPQEPRLLQVKERRKQLSLRQVSRRSEDNDDARFRKALVLPVLLDPRQSRCNSHIRLPCFLANSDPGQRATDQND